MLWDARFQRNCFSFGPFAYTKQLGIAIINSFTYTFADIVFYSLFKCISVNNILTQQNSNADGNTVADPDSDTYAIDDNFPQRHSVNHSLAK